MENIMLEKGRANVIVRGGNTLFMLTAEKPDGNPRDANLAREQISFILGVPPKEIVPNHNYKGKPKDAAYVFRYKGIIRGNVHSIGLPKSKRGQFINKSILFNFIDEEEVPKPIGKTLQPMPGTEKEIVPQREEEAAPTPPISTDDTMMLLLTQVLKNQQYLAEIVGKMALKL